MDQRTGRQLVRPVGYGGFRSSGGEQGIRRGLLTVNSIPINLSRKQNKILEPGHF